MTPLIKGVMELLAENGIEYMAITNRSITISPGGFIVGESKSEPTVRIRFINGNLEMKNIYFDMTDPNSLDQLLGKIKELIKPFL